MTPRCHIALVALAALSISSCAAHPPATGGHGGEGETGGSGGGAAVCGDRKVEGSEQCDDGNVLDGDGCSSTCADEGVCSAPIDFAKQATVNGEQLEVRGNLPDRPSKEDACGSAGPDWVYRQHTGPGVLRFGVAGTGSVFSYASTACGHFDTSAVCASGGSVASLRLDSEQDVYLVVDGPANAKRGAFLLATRLFPFKAAGEACDFDTAQCGDGLVCQQGTCTPDSRPVLDSGSILIGANGDVFLDASGSDPDGDVYAFTITFRDAGGSPIDASELGHWDASSSSSIVWFTGTDPEHVPGSFAGRVWTLLPGFMLNHPNARTGTMWLRDVGSVSAKSLTLPLQPQPARSDNQECDRWGVRDVCPADEVCRAYASSTSFVCGPMKAFRRSACEAAALLELGKSVDGVVVKRAQSLWEPPRDCLAEADPELGQPETVYRLHLNQATADLHLTTDIDGRGIPTVISLYPDCGEDDPPLACNEYGANSQQNGSILDLPEPAGDFLVVVDSTEGAGPIAIEADAP